MPCCRRKPSQQTYSSERVNPAQDFGATWPHDNNRPILELSGDLGEELSGASVTREPVRVELCGVEEVCRASSSWVIFVMASLPVIAEPATLRTKAEGLYLAELLQELRAAHPDLVQQAQLALQARPAPIKVEARPVEREAAEEKSVTRLAEENLIERKTISDPAEVSPAEKRIDISPVKESPAEPPTASVSGQAPASARESRPIREIPDRQYAPLFHVDSTEERREVELLASQYMDGYDNGADWVYRDRRCGTVREWDEVRGFGFLLEDLTEQEVFVSRRAVKRLMEPKWRHNLKTGERVTFCKLGSRRGYWAVAVLRVADTVPERVLKRDRPGVAAQEVKAPVEEVPVVTPPRAESPTSGPVISGSIHAGPHATLNLATHNYAPAPLPAAEKRLSVTVKPVSPAAVIDPSLKAQELAPSAQRLTRVPAAPGYRFYEEVGVNPYLHRGEMYCAVRGPAIRRVYTTSDTQRGGKFFKRVI